MEDDLQQLLCRVVFGGFQALTGTWAIMNKRKLQNLPKKKHCTVTVVAPPQEVINIFPRRNFKDNGQRIFFIINALS